MQLRSGLRSLTAVSTMVFLCASGAHAGPTGPYFTITDLGTLGGANSQVYDINAAGQIVGYGLINGHQHAFLLTPAPLPPRANIQVSASLDLGPVLTGNSSPSRSLTITNNGTAPLSISRVVVNGASPSDFQVSGGTGLTVAARASTDLTVTFSPKGTGSQSTSLMLLRNALNSPTFDKLTGIGVAPPPGAPSGLSARAFGYGKISLAWTDNSSNETAFEVYRQVGSGGFSLNRRARAEYHELHGLHRHGLDDLHV
jgi:probable HAF family extracellular repeat protein